MFHVPGDDGDQLVVRVPGSEPVVATRVDGELTAVAPVRDGNVAEIAVFDATGKLLGATETAVSVRSGLSLTRTHDAFTPEQREALRCFDQ